MELSREQQQYILNGLADIGGRERGVNVTFTLKEEPVQQATSAPGEREETVGRDE